QHFEPFRCALQFRIETADAQSDQGCFHAINEAASLTNKTLALAARPLAILLIECWDGHHFAVITLATQPSQEGTLQVLRVQPIGLSTPVLTRDSDARRVDHVRLNIMCPQPARHPES